jgi:hypothetical protein
MSDTKETKPEGGGEQITIRVRDQVRKKHCTLVSSWERDPLTTIKLTA